MKIIFGLGNPGEKYLKSRHNAGFQVLDILKEKIEFTDFVENKKFSSLLSDGYYNEEKLVLVKPLTYMNLSGGAVRKIGDYYKLNISDLWVIYDDLDFKIGEFKIRKQGGPGTHNGLKSIAAETGSTNFPRWKIGIESRTDEEKAKIPLRDFVLSKFTSSEEKIMTNVRTKSVESILFALEKGLQDAMNKYN